MYNMKTAEEFIEETYSSVPYELDQIIELMKEFAKLHVQEALEQAAENAKIGYLDGYGYINKKSILTAYPLDNIK